MNHLKNLYHAFKAVPEKYLFVLAFALIYSLVSLVNHYFFRTYALDLGLYSNALYDYAHFQWNDSTTFKQVPENLMGDHFDFYLMIYSPLVWIFGSYTLLIIQIVSVLFGGLGVHRYFRENRFQAALAQLFFYSFFGVFIALSYDFHDSVVVAMLVPWLFVFTKERKMKWAAFFVVFLWLGKENSALWVAFICFGLSLLHWKERTWRFFLIASGFASLVYFVVLMKFVMPALSSDGVYPHFDYNCLGATMPEAIAHLIKHPLDSLRLLVSNFKGDPMGDNIKSDLLKFLLFSGLGVLLFRPAYLLMLVPVFFQKLFHDSMNIWGAGFHYCIEFTPILAIGIFEVTGKIRRSTLRKATGGIVVASAIVVTYIRLGDVYLYAQIESLDFLSKAHYEKSYDVQPVYEAFKQIPPDAIVSSQSNLLPHLANRDFCYMYPVIKDAEYVILAKKDSSYPLSDSLFQVEIRNFQQSGDWIKLVDNKEVLLLKRQQ